METMYRGLRILVTYNQEEGYVLKLPDIKEGIAGSYRGCIDAMLDATGMIDHHLELSEEE